MMQDNIYRRQMNDSQIASREYRDYVGGNWEMMGQRQFDFMIEHGLKPAHYLLDVGCGALRPAIIVKAFVAI